MAQTGYTPILIYSSSTASNAPAAGNLTNSTLGSELAINITDGKLFYKDNANAIQVIGWKTTPTTAGGTGLTSYTAGDLLYFASGTTLSKLAIGASTTILTSSGTAPQWSSASGITVGTATNIAGGAAGSVPYQTGAGATSLLAIGTAYYQLGVNAGGTAPAWQPSATSVLTTQGDLLYASAANTLARLAKNTTASRYLSNSGASNNPAWAQVDLTNGVTGTLPTTNGGTGLASFSANQVFFASSTSAVGQSANFTWDGTSLVAGATSNTTAGVIVRQLNTSNGILQLASSGKLYQIRGGDYQGCLELFTDTGAGDILFTVGNTLRGRMNASGFKPVAGKGIDYSANSGTAGVTSQLLNWYEEGTFTPTVVGSTSAGTATYGGANGRYTRIGRTVEFEIYLDWSSGTGTGNLLFGGLPYSANGSTPYASVTIGYIHNFTWTAGKYPMALTIGTQVNFFLQATGGGSIASMAYSANGTVYVSGTYTV